MRFQFVTTRILAIGAGKQIFVRVVDNSVIMMIVGATIGFIMSLIIFFFEDYVWGFDASIIPCDRCGIDSARFIFNKIPTFLAWIMLFMIHTGIAVGLGLVSFNALRQHVMKDFDIGKAEKRISTFMILVMVLVSSMSYIIPFEHGQYYDWPVSPLNNLYSKIGLLHLIGIAAASCGVLGLIFIGCICRTLARGENLPDNIVAIYLKLKDNLERFLMITGFILTSGMVTVYFFHASLVDMNLGSLFDKHGLALVGVLFTIFIAVCFIPARLLLSDLGRRIADKYLKEPQAGTVDDVKAWLDARNEMEKYLHLRFSLLESIEYAIPVLAPIVGSVLPNFL